MGCGGGICGVFEGEVAVVIGWEALVDTSGRKSFTLVFVVFVVDCVDVVVEVVSLGDVDSVFVVVVVDVVVLAGSSVSVLAPAQYVSILHK